MYEILLVEDDNNILELLKIHLLDLACEVTAIQNGREAIDMAFKNHFDLIILDVMLPGMNGLEICRRIRMNNKSVAIMMVSAKSEEIDKVIGLETGADDYLSKPLSIREFIARVKAIFRRTKEAEVDAYTKKMELKFDGLEIDIEKRKIIANNNRIELSPKEFELLKLLATNPGKSYSRKRLLNLVWGYDFDGYEHTVNSHINRLRAKIESDITNPKYILTTWGVGYRFTEGL